MKTVAIKVEDDLHAQMVLIAQLDGVTLTEVIRQAVENYVEQLRSGDGLAAKAEGLLAVIEQETATKKEAVTALLTQLRPTTNGSKSRGRSKAAAQG